MEEPYYDVNQSDWYEENDVSEAYDSEDLSEDAEEDEHFFVEWAGYI